MPKLYFSFGIHNHQPVGNFDFVFRKALKDCYLPFLEVLEKHPAIKCNVHFTGPLYEWLKNNKEKIIFDKLHLLLKRGQIEILGGAFYEPILPVIPYNDQISQIKLMSSFIKKEFGSAPKGMWLAERVWEPQLASALAQANIQYTLLDDAHFRYAGFVKKDFFGYYITENEAKPVNIFPISKRLRYKIPFSKPQEALDLLLNMQASGGGGRLITLVDDGEKFGLWPGTFDWVYKQGWLDNFFGLLEKNKDKIETIKLSDAQKRFRPERIAYLPAASYQEMMEWVLEPSAYRYYENTQQLLKNSGEYELSSSFVRGGFFRNFCHKYPRLNYMQKRMFFLSKLFSEKADAAKDKVIFKHLWRAQCNCGYWHGVFGGFYLTHIRGAIYRNLIKAKKIFDERYSKKGLQVYQEDLDFDSYAEIIASNAKMEAVFTEKGALLLELSSKTGEINFINTITRQKENYHNKIKENLENNSQEVKTIHENINFKDKNLENYLTYDNYEKVCFIDFLLKQNYPSGRDSGLFLGNSLFSCKKNKDCLEFFLGEKSFSLLKRFKIKKGSLDAFYSLKTESNLAFSKFGVEFNIFVPSAESSYIRCCNNNFSVKGKNHYSGVSDFNIIDNTRHIELKFKFDKAEVYFQPIYSVSSSEGGLEKNFQQLNCFIVFSINKKAADFFISLSNI